MFFLHVVISLYARSISDELIVMISPSLFRSQVTVSGLLISMYSGKHPGTSFNTGDELSTVYNRPANPGLLPWNYHFLLRHLDCFDFRFQRNLG